MKLRELILDIIFDTIGVIAIFGMLFVLLFLGHGMGF